MEGSSWAPGVQSLSPLHRVRESMRMNEVSCTGTPHPPWSPHGCSHNPGGRPHWVWLTHFSWELPAVSGCWVSTQENLPTLRVQEISAFCFSRNWSSSAEYLAVDSVHINDRQDRASQKVKVKLSSRWRAGWTVCPALSDVDSAVAGPAWPRDHMSFSVGMGRAQKFTKAGMVCRGLFSAFQTVVESSAGQSCKDRLSCCYCFPQQQWADLTWWHGMTNVACLLCATERKHPTPHTSTSIDTADDTYRAQETFL